MWLIMTVFTNIIRSYLVSVAEGIFNDRIIHSIKRNFFLLASFLLVCTFTLAQEIEILFDVMFRDEKVGVLNAQEKKSESKSLKVLIELY